MESVSIILRPNETKEFHDVLQNLVTWLTRRKKMIFFLSKEEKRLRRIFKNFPKNIHLIKETELGNHSDLILSLGGDGTLIGVCRKAMSKSVPIFGINMGTLGFITEFSKIDFYEDLERTMKGQFVCEKIPLYKVKVFKNQKIISSHYFFNDIVVNKNNISRMMTLSVETEEDQIYNLAGDGLIVSTPLGSTAYSMAAGGPIIHRCVNAMVITPICPHSLNYRPIVIPDKMKVIIKIPYEDEDLALTLDGQEMISLNAKYRLEISKASPSKGITLIKNPDRSYFRTLKEKFTHGRRIS